MAIDPKYYRLAPLLVFLVIAMAMTSGLFNGKQAHRPTLLDARLPDIALPHVEEPGRRMLSRSWQGRMVLINVFASWCRPCAAEHPLLLRLAGEGLPIYGIAWRDRPDAVMAYLGQGGNPYREVGVDGAGALTVPLGLTGVPETLLIDPQGIVRWHYSGQLDEETVSNELVPLVRRYGRTP